MRTSSRDWAEQFYCDAMDALRAAEIPFLVGGAYAFGRYTGIIRDTKDFDLFLEERHLPAALRALEDAGYRAGMAFSHWLAKVHHGDAFIDLIFRAGNGLCDVDDAWFRAAVKEELLGQPVLLVPAERMIWQKAYIQERERYDGADVAHLLRSCAPKMNWDELLALFGPDWRVLYAHLVLFGFIYPAERRKIPDHVMSDLARRLDAEVAATPPTEHLCCGTLLSRAQYLPDVEVWKYRDARLLSRSTMTAEQIHLWTNAIGR